MDGWQLGTLAVTVEADCLDADGDKVGDCEGDCDDTDAEVYPGAEETWYDGVDSDCDVAYDDDADGDGVPLAEDCDDADPERAEDCDTGEPDADDTGGEDDGGAGADDGGDVGGDGASDDVDEDGTSDDGDAGVGEDRDGGCGGGKALVLPLGLGALLGLRRRRQQWRSPGVGA